METISYNKYRYRRMRRQGLCVACGKPAQKSRCDSCMKALSQAVAKSSKNRTERMKNSIKELEAMLNV